MHFCERRGPSQAAKSKPPGSEEQKGREARAQWGERGGGRISSAGLTPDWLEWFWRKSEPQLASRELSNFSAALRPRFRCPDSRAGYSCETASVPPAANSP